MPDSIPPKGPSGESALGHGEIPAGEPAGAAGISESLFEIAWRNRWLVLLCVVLVLTVGFVYVMKATPIYTSTSRLYVEQAGPRILSETEGVMTQSKNYLYTQAELLRSTPILRSALEDPAVRSMQTFRDVDNVVAYLKKNVQVEVGKKDDIISVAFDSPYPAEAAHLVNTLVDAYINYHATQKQSTSTEILNILRKEKVRVNEELREKLKAMVDFKRENEGLAFESTRGNIILDRLARLSEAVTQAQLATIEAKSRYEMIQAMAADPVGLRQQVEAEMARTMYTPTTREKERLRQELDQWHVTLADLRTRLTDDHPSIQHLLRRIETTEKRIEGLDAEFATVQVALARQDYEAARQREEEVTRHFEAQREMAIGLNEQLAQYMLLESDWQQSKKLSDILDDRIKELNITEDVGALNISILEVAQVEDKPSKPQKARVMAIALALGLMLGGGVSLGREMMDHRLRSTEEIQVLLGLPVLGSVPSMGRRRSVQACGQIVEQEAGSVTAEAYRTVRTAVFFGVPEGTARTLLVTSPGTGDGKTTLVSNLGIAMSQAGQKTLIIDADLRKPMQHAVFKLNREPGLSSVISGRMSLAEAIQPTGVHGLDILLAGPDVPNPSEMLNSNVFRQKLEELAGRYDRIVIDSPPVIPVSDARILAALCDVSLLVLRAESSTRNMSRHACEGLYSVGARLLGVVVNGVHRRKGGYGYYSRYGYSSYGGYGHAGTYGHKKTAG